MNWIYDVANKRVTHSQATLIDLWKIVKNYDPINTPLPVSRILGCEKNI